MRYKSQLAFRHFTAPRWSNIKSDLESQPYGAGMCLRANVCHRYAEDVSRSPLRQSLGRKGASLLAGEDIDLVLTSSQLNLGWGNFPSLMMNYLIPPTRTEETYLMRLREEVVLSTTIIAAMNGFAQPVPPSWRYHLQWVWRRLRYGRHESMFMTVERRGQRRGLEAARSSGT